MVFQFFLKKQHFLHRGESVVDSRGIENLLATRLQQLLLDG